MRQIRLPSLPSYPQLLINNRAGLAVIIGRHESPNSMGLARLVSFFLFLASFAGVGYVGWQSLSIWSPSFLTNPSHQRLLKILAWILGLSVFAGLWRGRLKRPIQTWLRNSFFYTTTRIYITAHHVGFKSARYRRGVRFPRRIRCGRIGLDVISTDDPQNPVDEPQTNNTPPSSTPPRRQGRHLVLLVTTWPPERPGQLPPRPDRRAIPINQMPTSLCRKFHVVCSAAMRVIPIATPSQHRQGHSLDQTYPTNRESQR